MLYLEKSSVSRSIDCLEKRGWIERRRSPHDSRSKIVSLSEKALCVVEKGKEIAAKVLLDAQQGVDESQLQTTKENLSETIANLRQLNKKDDWLNEVLFCSTLAVLFECRTRRNVLVL